MGATAVSAAGAGDPAGERTRAGEVACDGPGQRHRPGPGPGGPTLADGIGIGIDERAGGRPGDRTAGGVEQVRRGGGAVRGTVSACLGVAAFSLTFPSTHWALSGFGPWAAVGVRAVLAAVVAGVFLAVRRAPVPARAHWPGLAVVAGGVVLGFPLLTTLALGRTDTSHAAVVVGALPLCTAALGALRTGTRPSRTFWAAAVAGAAVVVGFALGSGGGGLTGADAYLFASLLVCAAGYVEGGRLAAVMPGGQVMGWALVGVLPLTLPGAVVALACEPPRLTGESVGGLAWVSVVSQFLGMVVWYRGMAVIGVARASQLQLAQPALTLVWSAALLGEHLGAATLPSALAVLVCVAVTQRTGQPSRARSARRAGDARPAGDARRPGSTRHAGSTRRTDSPPTGSPRRPGSTRHAAAARLPGVTPPSGAAPRAGSGGDEAGEGARGAHSHSPG